MNTIELFEVLTDPVVDDVLVGGLAVQLHGFMRVTFDIEPLLATDKEKSCALHWRGQALGTDSGHTRPDRVIWPIPDRSNNGIAKRACLRFR